MLAKNNIKSDYKTIKMQEANTSSNNNSNSSNVLLHKNITDLIINYNIEVHITIIELNQINQIMLNFEINWQSSSIFCLNKYYKNWWQKLKRGIQVTASAHIYIDILITS